MFYALSTISFRTHLTFFLFNSLHYFPWFAPLSQAEAKMRSAMAEMETAQRDYAAKLEALVEQQTTHEAETNAMMQVANQCSVRRYADR